MHQAAAAGVLPAAPAHIGPGPGPGTAPASAQTHSQFHQQRAGVLRPMARPAPPPSPAATRNRSAQQARSAAAPENALLTMIANAEGGDAGDDDHRYDGADRDPLRREARLHEAAERQPDGVGALARQDAPTGSQDAAALQQMQERLGGGAEIGGASAADDALALVEQMGAHGDATLADRVKELRRGASLDPAMHRPGADGVQVWIAQRLSASFNLLDACLQHGASLHAQLSGNALLAPGAPATGLAPAERIGVALLEAGRSGGAAALAGRVGALGGRGRDGRNASQLIAATLRELPHALWPTKDARARLLHETDLAADDGSAPAGAEERTERTLRTVHDTQENHHA